MEKLPMTIIVRITQEQYDDLAQTVKSTGRTISEIIRDMIQLFIDVKKG
jgi:predicted DNA-binding protein